MATHGESANCVLNRIITVRNTRLLFGIVTIKELTEYVVITIKNVRIMKITLAHKFKFLYWGLNFNGWRRTDVS